MPERSPLELQRLQSYYFPERHVWTSNQVTVTKRGGPAAIVRPYHEKTLEISGQEHEKARKLLLVLRMVRGQTDDIELSDGEAVSMSHMITVADTCIKEQQASGRELYVGLRLNRRDSIGMAIVAGVSADTRTDPPVPVPLFIDTYGTLGRAPESARIEPVVYETIPNK